jgi:hypothetical protein
MARLEDKIQEAIVKYLHYVLVDKIIISIPNEGRRSPAQAVRLKRMGMRPGAADLLLIWRGTPYFFEIKTAKGVLSDAQMQFREECLGLGIHYTVVRSLDDMRRSVLRLGIETKAHRMGREGPPAAV